MFEEFHPEVGQATVERQDQLAEDIHAQLSPQLERCVELASARGSSSWLIALPLSS